MILISNKQRDDIVRYLDTLCQCLTGRDSRTVNTKRLARNLAKGLKAKQPFDASALPDIIKNSSKIK